MESLPGPKETLPKITIYMADAQSMDVGRVGLESYLDESIASMQSENPFLVESLHKLYVAMDMPPEINGLYVGFNALSYRLLKYPGEIDIDEPSILPILNKTDDEFIKRAVATRGTIMDVLLNEGKTIAGYNAYYFTVATNNLGAMNVDKLGFDTVFTGLLAMHGMLRRATE